MSELNNRKWSPKEWWVFIGLLLLGEYVLLDLAYRFGNNELIVSHVSFAATIASILLAVIAIIYGFMQSSTQQSSTEKMATQIDSLKGVVEQVTESRATLEHDLKAISGITIQLQDISAGVSESKQRISDVSQDVRKLQQVAITRFAEMVPSAPSMASGVSVEQISALVVSSPKFGLFWIEYLIWRFKDKEIPETVRPGTLVAKMFVRVGEEPTEYQRSLGMGTWIGVLTTLGTLGLLQDWKITKAITVPAFRKALDGRFASIELSKLNFDEDSGKQLESLKAELDKVLSVV